MWASDKVMPVIVGRAVGAALIESLVFCSLAFMVRMDDSVEKWFSGTLCLTKQTASGPRQWTQTELASSCNVNKWVTGSQAWILHVLLRRSADSDWSQRRLGGACRAMERTDVHPELPVSPVLLFTGALEAVRRRMKSVSDPGQTAWLRPVNAVEIVRTGDWPWESS